MVGFLRDIVMAEPTHIKHNLAVVLMTQAAASTIQTVIVPAISLAIG